MTEKIGKKLPLPLTAPVFYTRMSHNSVDREQYPMSGHQREGGWCKPFDRHDGKALWSAGRKWPAGPRRYRVRVRISQMRIQVEPRTCIMFALSLYGLRAILLRLRP